MIIELFGPECSGKTTFARALAARLRERNYQADVALSCRPAENAPDSAGNTSRHDRPSLSRLLRSATEAMGLALHPMENARDIRTAVGLVRILPPGNPYWTIKQAQYLARLSRLWRELSCKSPIALFDQAFLQVVCSLLLLGGLADDAIVAAAIEYVPRADLLIRVGAPLDVLEARLRARKEMQSGFEQLFEFDLATSLASVLAVERLHGLLVERGRTVLSVASSDQCSIDDGVGAVEDVLLRKLAMLHRGTA